MSGSNSFNKFVQSLVYKSLELKGQTHRSLKWTHESPEISAIICCIQTRSQLLPDSEWVDVIKHAGKILVFLKPCPLAFAKVPIACGLWKSRCFTPAQSLLAGLVQGMSESPWAEMMSLPSPSPSALPNLSA